MSRNQDGHQFVAHVVLHVAVVVGDAEVGSAERGDGAAEELVIEVLDSSRHAQFHPVEDAARVELGPGRRRRPLPARRRPAGT